MNALKALILQRIAEMPDERFASLDREASFFDNEEQLREKVYRAVVALENETRGLSQSDRIALVFSRLLDALTTTRDVPESIGYHVSVEDKQLISSIIQSNSGLFHRLAK